jgi:hypothetical protein
MTPRDPFEELSNAPGFSMEKDTLDSHIAEIDTVLASRRVTPMRKLRPPIMRWVAAAVILLGIGAPTAVVASADSLPGDLLYPIKQIVEPILIRFDPEVVARHRIEEVIELRARNLPIDDILREAEEAVDRLPSDSPLRDELADLETRDQLIDSPPTSTEPPPDTAVRPPATSTRTTQVSDVSGTTVPRTTTIPTPSDRATTTLPEADR